MATKPSSSHKKDDWSNSSTCRAVAEAGESAGREYGSAEATSRTLAHLLARQANQKFGMTDPAGRATLDGLAQAFACSQLEELADRLVAAASWSEWLSGVVVPPPAPGMPDYTKSLILDLEPSGPSIDMHMRARTVAGTSMLVHLRLQKWYQPNLDRHLYEESLKIERRYGQMPNVGVILMWPKADGPGMTGEYIAPAARGKPKRIFKYTIRRAWEMTPEEALSNSGTMVLAPLTRGARERMPEIVQLLKQEINKDPADPESKGWMWIVVYWSMGLVCDLDEAHRALGELVPYIQSTKGYLATKGAAFVQGCSAAQSEAVPTASRALVLRQATLRFGTNTAAAERLSAIHEVVQLEALADKVLTAPDWTALLQK